MNAPIAVFAYRRADHLDAMLRSLRACEGFKASSVTIFVDGPKSAADREGVEAVRRLVAGLNLPNVSAVIRQENWGLRRSIFEGVGALCREHGRVIVLEDDLELAPTTLTYFNDALDKYAADPRVWSVSAYMYDVPWRTPRETAFFLPMGHPWGWATWDRAWRQFGLDDKIDPTTLRQSSFRRAFNCYGIRDWTDILDLSLAGKVNSWFIRWYWTMFRAGGLTLFPPQSFVWNLGISGDGGTHASRLNPYYALVPRRTLATEVPELPAEAGVDFRAIDEIRGSWDARVQRLISVLGRLKRQFKR